MYIVVKGTITDAGGSKRNRSLAFKTMHHILVAFQKSIA